MYSTLYTILQVLTIRIMDDVLLLNISHVFVILSTCT